LAFHLEQATNGAARVVWDGPSRLTEADLVERQQPGKLDAAVEFLEGSLANGERSVNELRVAATAVGISYRTLERARAKLNLTPYRKGFGRGGQVFLTLLVKEDTSKETSAHNNLSSPLPSAVSDTEIVGTVYPVAPLASTTHTEAAVSAEDWEERAAIAEFDGLLTRNAAEQTAGPRPVGLLAPAPDGRAASPGGDETYHPIAVREAA
jgi:hypothetical protein